MSRNYFLLLFFILPYCIIGQDYDLDSLQLEVNKQAKYFEAELARADDYLSDEDKAMWIEFQVDTFKIERFLSARLELFWTTAGMVDAVRDAEIAYDGLLNKYYKKLMTRLEPEDQETLRQAQRNWIKFRDAERELIDLLYSEKYTGGGTMYYILLVDDYLGITRRRVFELFHHYASFY